MSDSLSVTTPYSLSSMLNDWSEGDVQEVTWLTDSCVVLEVDTVIKGEMSAKTTYQRSAKGPVAIQECSPDGKFVVLENTGRKVRLASPFTAIAY